MTGIEVKKPNPWVALVLGTLPGPVVGFCYVARPGLGLLYEGMTFATALFLGWAVLAVLPIVALHAYYSARSYRRSDRPIYSRWPALIVITLSSAVVVNVFLAYVVGVYRVSGSSMEPNVARGARPVILKMAFRPLGRGDIIAYRGDRDRLFIHRIVGLPGDEITIRGDALTLNGTQVRYELLQNTDVGATYLEHLPGGVAHIVLRRPRLRPSIWDVDIVVPTDSYYVLGDNRDGSGDSRAHGPISEDRVIGKAIFVPPWVLPFERPPNPKTSP